MSDQLDSPAVSEFIIPESVYAKESDNLKAIERWANNFMRASCPLSRCMLFIPHQRLTSLSPGYSLDNWSAIERWAQSVVAGRCGAMKLPTKCDLFIPYKTVLGDLQAGRITLGVAQEREFVNYKAVENWANRLHRGEC